MFLFAAMRQAATEVGDTDGLASAPWWAKAALRFGLPAVAAIAVTVFALNLVGNDLRQSEKALTDTVTHHMQQSAEDNQRLAVESARSTRAVEELSQRLDANTRLLQLICLGVARDESGRRSCLSINTTGSYEPHAAR